MSHKNTPGNNHQCADNFCSIERFTQKENPKDQSKNLFLKGSRQAEPPIEQQTYQGKSSNNIHMNEDPNN